MRKLRSNGFTLIEIMIVIAVIALLIGVVVPGILRARISANQTSAQATLISFAKACELYAAANAALYPTLVSDLTDGSAPYFSYDPTLNSKEGYNFTVSFAGNGYTLTASALPNAGNWDYQVTTSVVLKRSEIGEDNWQAF